MRHLTDITPRPATPPSAGPLKILAAVAAPDERPARNTPLDVEAEMQAILDAVTPLDTPAAGQLDLAALGIATPNPTPPCLRRRRRPGHRCGSSRWRHCPEIRDALGAEQFHVLHLSAHGWPDADRAGGRGRQPRAGQPGPARLCLARREDTRCRLLVLSSCSGAAAAPEGLAGRVIRSGGDRVIAMQAPVTDRYATLLTHALYRELAHTIRPAPSPPPSPSPAPSPQNRYLNATRRGNQPAPPPEWAVPTLLAANTDTPCTTPASRLSPSPAPLAGGPDRGVRELPLGELIGRRPLLREAWSVIRRNQHDRDTDRRMGRRSR